MLQKIELWWTIGTTYAILQAANSIFSVKEGWPRLREFLNLPNNGDEFPHENKNANTVDFVSELWTDTAAEYDKKVEEEVCAWMRNNGYECKKIQPNKE